MSAVSKAEAFSPRLTSFESEFVQTVLEHRGILTGASLTEFADALEVLRRYDERCSASPGHDTRYAPRVDAGDLPALRAKAFLLFGTVQPNAAQWHLAHQALFGPLLCENCG